MPRSVMKCARLLSDSNMDRRCFNSRFWFQRSDGDRLAMSMADLNGVLSLKALRWTMGLDNGQSMAIGRTESGWTSALPAWDRAQQPIALQSDSTADSYICSSFCAQDFEQQLALQIVQGNMTAALHKEKRQINLLPPRVVWPWKLSRSTSGENYNDNWCCGNQSEAWTACGLQSDSWKTHRIGGAKFGKPPLLGIGPSFGPLWLFLATSW